MLDSKAVVSIIKENNKFVVCIRHNYEPKLSLYTFYKWQQKFKTEIEAAKFIGQTFPKCKIVDINNLTNPNV